MLPWSRAHRILLPTIVLLTLCVPVTAPFHRAARPVTSMAVPQRALLTDQAELVPARPVLLARPTAPAPVPAKARVDLGVRARAAVVARPLRRSRGSRARSVELRPGWEARHGDAALSLISYPWRDLGWDISFHAARPGLLGLASEPEKHIYIFVRRNQSPRELAFTISHEIGHAYDFTLGTRESHNRWLELRGIDRTTPWSGCDGCSDFRTPAGDFAEVFAVWQVGPVDFRSRMAPLPEGERLRMLSQEFTGSTSATGT